MKKYILYTAENGERYVSPKGEKFSLEELQSFVGGYIEIVRLDGRFVLVIDEEGKLKGKPMNLSASWLFLRYNKVTDYIAGDALLVPAEMID